MRSVTYSMSVSLDGYIVGPDGDFGWTAPDEEVFRFVTDEIRQVGVHLLGRRLYETMLYWETADQDPSLDDSRLEWAAIWKPLPKVVFSTTLSAVQGNARLACGGLAEEIERLRAGPGEGDIAIGGATLAAEAAALGLIDEYRARVCPVLVGGGIPFLPQRERRVDLELVETRTFDSGVVYLRHRGMLRRTVADTNELPRDRWRVYFDDLSRGLATTQATVEIEGPDLGAQVQAEGLVLVGISYDDRDDVLVIGLSPGGATESLEHLVSSPQRIRVEPSDAILPATVEVEDAEGERTLVRLQPAPALPA
jgi:dihydrofolate reductase